jgi:hypothetical protein
MALPTLRDLHALSGSQDLSHWGIHSVYSVFEAALLTAGVDPLRFEAMPEYERATAMYKEAGESWIWAASILKAMKQSICMGSLRVETCWTTPQHINDYPSHINQDELTIDMVDEVCIHKTMIARWSLKKWYKEKGFLANAEQPRATVTPIVEPKVLLMPQYSTPAMECLNEVCREFWHDYDPNGNRPPPKQDVIRLWLKENGHKWGVTSDRMAAAIDLIARHPAARDRTNKN